MVQLLIKTSPPPSLDGLTIQVDEYETRNGESVLLGSYEVEYKGDQAIAWEEDEQAYISEKYIYEKTGPTTGKLTVSEEGDYYEVNFTFTTQDTGTGTWKEEDAESGDYEGTLKFEIIGNDYHHQDDEHEFVKLEDVKTFVDPTLSEFASA